MRCVPAVLPGGMMTANTLDCYGGGCYNNRGHARIGIATAKRRKEEQHLAVSIRLRYLLVSVFGG